MGRKVASSKAKPSTRRAPATAKSKLTREQKSELTRRAIIEAAAKVVGRYGYERASIARITTRAKVAHGSFYSYFKSRQELFDCLLPEIGNRLLNFIKDNVAPDAVGAAREEQRLRAYFKFIKLNPWFQRLLDESAVMAPAANEQYFEQICKGYARGLSRGISRGEIRGFAESELEVIAYILMSSRLYLSQKYRDSESAEAAIGTYMKLVERALFK